MQPTGKLVLLPQAINVLLEFTPKLGWLFRGHADASWDLLPRAGRSPFYIHSGPVNPANERSRYNPPRDLGRFNHWRDLASGYCSAVPSNDFECLAFAQHYGLPTRLLDFTENALAALYFACESMFDRDAALFAYHPWIYVDPKTADLHSHSSTGCLRIRPFDRRMLAQRAAFVFFADPAVPLSPRPLQYSEDDVRDDEVDLVKFIIPAKSKIAIQRQLQDIGVTRSTLFPDLDGLSDDFVKDDFLRAAFSRVSEKRKP